jgi:hypothetical protein
MFVLLVFVYLVVVVEMAPDQNSQFDLDSSMMAEFEADFLVLVFQVASELVEKLGLHFVQPFVDLVLTEVDTFDLDLDLTVLTVDWRNFVEVVEHLDLDLEFVSQAFVMLAGCNLLRQTSANKYDNNYRNGL